MPDIVIKTPEEMRDLGLRCAKEVLRTKKNKNRAKVIALYGNLGSGKTTFAQGFGKGLRISKRIQSPTFVLMRRYSLFRDSQVVFKRFYHLDLYRIKNEKDAEYLALKELFNDPSAIVLIEWADRIKEILPKRTARVVFKHTKNRRKRAVQFLKQK